MGLCTDHLPCSTPARKCYKAVNAQRLCFMCASDGKSLSHPCAKFHKYLMNINHSEDVDKERNVGGDSMSSERKIAAFKRYSDGDEQQSLDHYTC